MSSGNLFTESFSNCSAVADLNLKWNGPPFSVGWKAVGAPYALGASPQGGQLIGGAASRNLGANYAHLFYGIRHKLQAGYSVLTPEMGGFCDGGNQYQVSWGRNSSGTLFVARGGNLGGAGYTLLATSTLTVAAGSTHYYEMEAIIDPSGGLINLWVDGTLFVTFSGNTRATANSYANNLQVYAGQNGGELWCTDCYVNQSGGSFLNGRLGPVDIKSLKFSAAGSHADFTRGGVDTGTNVGQLNKTLVGIASFNTDFVVGHRDSFLHDALAAGTILGAREWAYGQKDGGGARSLALTCTSGATDDIGANESVSGPGYAWYDRDVSADPATGVVWASLAALNAAEMGYKLTV